MWNDSTAFYNPSASKAFIHQKRKGESLMEIMPPLKMHINEDKMVSQLKGIHLSNSYTSHGSSSSAETDCSFLDYVLDNTSKNAEALPSLKMCDELKSQFNPSFRFSSSVPNSILDKFNKQCTALVLWKPPISSIGRTLSINGDEGSGDDAPDGTQKDPAAGTSDPSVPHPDDVEMMVDDDNNNSMNNNVRQPVISPALPLIPPELPLMPSERPVPINPF